MKKIISLLIMLVMLASLSLTACNMSAPSTDDDHKLPNQDGDHSDDLEGGEPDGDENGDGSPDTDGNGSGNGGDGDTRPVADSDLDLLALSLGRLENADLSFKFDMGFEGKKSTFTLTSSKSANDGEHEYYSVVPGDFPAELGGVSYFENEESWLDMLSKSARELADFMIENITVMNTVVSNDWLHYILNYDETTDTLSAISYGTEGDEVTSITDVRIYYDEGGKETVEMYSYSKDGVGVTVEYVFYAKDKAYTITRGWGEAGAEIENFSTSSAIKQNGMWRAVTAHFNTDNVLFTKDGVYDYGNGLLQVEFLVEDGDNLYLFSDTMRPFRGEGDTGSDVAALPTDEIRILPYTVSLAGVWVDMINGGFITLNTNLLTGWDEYRITIDNEYELEQTRYCEHYFNTAKDYFKLSSGEVFSYETKYWNDKLGFGTLEGYMDGSYFVDSDGNRHKVESGFRVAAVAGALAQITRERGEITSANIYLRGGDVSTTYAEQFDTLSRFFAAMGLGFVEGMPEDVFGSLASLIRGRVGYTGALFEELYGVDYTFEGYSSAMFSIARDINSFKSDFDAMLDGIEKEIDINSMPRRPSELALIPFASGLSGAATVSRDGIDFSPVTLSVAKSIILSEGSTYTVYVTLSSPDVSVTLDAFGTAVYAHTAMSFTGAKVALPTSLTPGSYSLEACLVKLCEDGSVIRLSEVSPLAVGEFEAFDERLDTEDGYFSYSYLRQDGALAVSVAFFDTKAPEISTDGLTADTSSDEVTYIYYAGEEQLAAAILSAIGVTDNCDGEIYTDLGMLRVENDPDAVIYENTPIQTDTVYVFTVCDSAGNESSIKILVKRPGADPTVPGGNTPDSPEPIE